MSKKISPGEIGRKVEIPVDGQPITIHGSTGGQPVLISGQTSAGSYFPLKIVKDGSVGQLDIHGVVGTVYVGTIAIGAIAGSVHIQGTIDTINYLGSVGHIKSGSIGVLGGSIGVKSGSIGILGQPIAITGSIDIRGGTVDITGSVGISSGSVGLLGGSVGVKSGSIGVLGGSVGVKSGSVGVLGGSIGIKNGSIGLRGGSVGIKSGSVGVLGGSIGIKNGSIGIIKLPAITGSVDIRGGTVDVDISSQSVGQLGADLQGNYFGPQTLIDGSVIGAGSTYTSQWASVDNYKTKTMTAKTQSSGSLTIEVAIIGTATDNYDFATEDLTANTMKEKTFTDAFRYCRAKVYNSGRGTVWCYLGRRIV